MHSSYVHTCTCKHTHTHNITHRILIKVHMNLISKLLLYFRILSQQVSSKSDSNISCLMTSQQETDNISCNLSSFKPALSFSIAGVDQQLKEVLSLNVHTRLGQSRRRDLFTPLSLTVAVLPSSLLISTILRAALVSRGRVLIRHNRIGPNKIASLGQDTVLNMRWRMLII